MSVKAMESECVKKRKRGAATESAGPLNLLAIKQGVCSGGLVSRLHSSETRTD